MKTLVRLVWAFLILCSCTLSAADSGSVPVPADWYEVTEVVLPKGGYGGELVGVNASGQVAGNFYNANDEGRGFLWKDGKFTTFLPPGAAESVVAGVNASGAVAGTSYNEDFDETGFLWSSGGGYTVLLPDGATSSSAQDINDAGQVVGYYYDAKNRERAFFWANGEFTTLLPSGTVLSEATAINGNGQVLGTATDSMGVTRGFLWQDGEFTFIDIAGTDGIFPYAVNDTGQVVGSYLDANDDDQAFLWQDGALTLLNPPGAVGSDAYSINAYGQVAGAYVDAKDNYLAFLWYDGRFVGLSAKLPKKSGWALEEVQQIADSGLMVGLGSLDGEEALFLLTPKAGVKPSAPTVKIQTSGGVVTRARVQVKGTAGGKVTAVYYRVGKDGDYAKASGAKKWKFRAKLKKGRNVISVYAEGPGGRSREAKVTIRRN